MIMKNIRNFLANFLLLAVAFGLYQACVPPANAVEIDLTLTWQDNATNEEGFKVYHRVGTSAEFQLIDTIAVADIESYVFTTNVTGGEVLQFVVTAYNTWLGQEQESGTSNIATKTVESNPGAPGAPTAASVVIGIVP